MLFNFPNSSDCNFASVKATLDVIQVLYIQKSIRFDIFVYAETSPKINCIIDGILKLKKDFKTSLNHVRNFKGWKHKFNESAIIFVKEKTDLVPICTDFKVLGEESIRNYKFLFIMDGVARFYAPDDIFAQVVIGYYSYILQILDNQIGLRRFEWFSRKECNNKTDVDNFFDSKSLGWKKKLEFPENFRNFHGCMIVNQMAFNGTRDYYIGVDGKAEGLIVDIFKILEKVGNFSVYHQLTKRKYIAKNGIILLEIVTMMESSFYPSSLENLHFTSVYDDQKYIFVITPGEPYNNYEKMILPFDTQTWIFLLSTFALTFLVILVVSFMPTKIQNLIFGEGIWTPALNVVYIFFGLGQMKLPSKWFPRFILLMFIIFCLIFRTCYQSLLFEFMTTDMRKSSPKTIMDLKERNFTLIVNPSEATQVFENAIKGKSYQPNFILIKWENVQHDFASFWDQASNFSAKFAFLVSSFDYLHQSPRRTYKYLDETLMTTFRAFGTHKNYFFFPLLSEILERLIPAGIPVHLRKLHEWIFYKKSDPPEEIGPQVLTMDDLMFGFVIWISTVGIAFAFFVIEFSF